VRTEACTVNCPARVTSALTFTCRRPSGGICCGAIGATRSPGDGAISTSTSMVTGNPLATVIRIGASWVPSEYGLGGSSTRTEPRRSSIRC
jgi:hypothetical protein